MSTKQVKGGKLTDGTPRTRQETDAEQGGLSASTRKFLESDGGEPHREAQASALSGINSGQVGDGVPYQEGQLTLVPVGAEVQLHVTTAPTAAQPAAGGAIKRGPPSNGPVPAAPTPGSAPAVYQYDYVVAQLLTGRLTCRVQMWKSTTVTMFVNGRSSTGVEFAGPPITSVHVWPVDLSQFKGAPLEVGKAAMVCLVTNTGISANNKMPGADIGIRQVGPARIQHRSAGFEQVDDLRMQMWPNIEDLDPEGNIIVVNNLHATVVSKVPSATGGYVTLEPSLAILFNGLHVHLPVLMAKVRAHRGLIYAFATNCDLMGYKEGDELLFAEVVIAITRSAQNFVFPHMMGSGVAPTLTKLAVEAARSLLEETT